MDENKQCMKECSWFKFLLAGPSFSQCTVGPLISWDGVKMHEYQCIKYQFVFTANLQKL